MPQSPSLPLEGRKHKKSVTDEIEEKNGHRTARVLVRRGRVMINIPRKKTKQVGENILRGPGTKHFWKKK